MITNQTYKGLTSQEAESKIERFGLNEIPEKKKESSKELQSGLFHL